MKKATAIPNATQITKNQLKNRTTYPLKQGTGNW